MVSNHVTAMSDRGVAWLVALEGGHRLEAYKDSGGVWTIGAGLIRWPNGKRVQYGDRISNPTAAVEVFRLVLSPYVADVDAMTRDDVTQNQFDALVSLCYNIGVSALARSTVLKRINGALPGISEAWLWFHYDNGHPSPGLLTRRKREIEVYDGHEYRDQGGIVIQEGATA